MDSIGVRELRQHASRYLQRVSRGECIQVTDRGRPVARLVPVPLDSHEALIAAGIITPAVDPGNIADLEPLDVPEGFSASAELAEMRRDER